MKRTQKLLCMGLFSKKLNGPLLTGQAVGAQGVPPTPGRSIAVDNARSAGTESVMAVNLGPEVRAPSSNKKPQPHWAGAKLDHCRCQRSLQQS